MDRQSGWASDLMYGLSRHWEARLYTSLNEGHGARVGDALVVLHIEQSAQSSGITQDLLQARTNGAQPMRRSEVIRVRTMDDGLAILSQTHVDCILVDHGDTDDADLEACREVTRRAPDTPVIMLAERSEIDFAVQAIRLGAEEVLVKERISAHSLWQAMDFSIARRRRLSRKPVMMAGQGIHPARRDTLPEHLAPSGDLHDPEGGVRDYRFPANDAAPLQGADTEQALREAVRAAEAAPEPDLPRILVVDDTKTNRDICEVMLKKFGFAYDLADSGARALQLAARQSYALVLMDIQMPDLDGIATTEQLRERGLVEDTPIVAVTSHSPPDARTHYLDAGMDDYLAKPLTARSLLNMIERHVPASMMPK